jgi:hypothetical protein
MLPGSQEYAERALDLEDAMPLKRDSTAMRALNTEDRMNATRTANVKSRRFTSVRRGEDSDIGGLLALGGGGCGHECEAL